MDWEPEAEMLMKRVPFFVRRFARKRIEQMVRAEGAAVVTAEACRRARARFADERVLAGEEASPAAALRQEEPQLWQVEACAGPERDCPFALRGHDELPGRLDDVFERLGYRDFARAHFGGLILPHHRLKVALCACPNGCTQPQIKDIGIVAHSHPAGGHAECTACGRCVEACPDGAVRLIDDAPVIDTELCVDCGACARACPTGALIEERSGYAITVGGRLGRHPHLAEELTVVPDAEQVVPVVERLVRRFMAQSRPGERFNAFAERLGVDALREGIAQS